VTWQVPLPGGSTLHIAPEVLATMWAFSQLGLRDPESGGILIGHRPVGGTDIVLDRLTTPQPGDRQTRTRFRRGRARHQALLDAHWRESGHTRTYLGEWHTHPEDDPSPSELDERNWRCSLRAPAQQAMGLLFIIVGRQTTRVWFGAPGQRTASLLAGITNSTTQTQGGKGTP